MQIDTLTALQFDLLKSLSSHSYNSIRKELLTKILKNINQPEERVRYYWVLNEKIAVFIPFATT